MPIPDYQALMLPVLQLAAASETRVPEVANKIANQLGLSEAECEEMLPSGRQRLLHNRVHWAKFYMSKAGLIDSPVRGRFTISEAGRKLLASKPKSLNVETLKTYPAFASFYSSSNSSAIKSEALSESTNQIIDLTASTTPEEQIDAAQAVLHQALKSDLLQRILTQSPAFFERAIVDLLVAMGYGGSHDDAARRLGKTGDGGIDGVIDEDRLGLIVYMYRPNGMRHMLVLDGQKYRLLSAVSLDLGHRRAYLLRLQVLVRQLWILFAIFLSGSSSLTAIVWLTL